MKHNFIDTPSDKCVVCNRTENLDHYFLHCTRFTEARRTLFDLLLTIINVHFEQLNSKDKIKLLLYGDLSLGNAVNKLLIEATLNFLRDSERFL